MRLKNILCITCMLTLTGCFDFSVPTVNRVDIPSYMGRWYQIAANETSFNRGLVAVTADYSLNPDGTVTVYNRALKGNFGGEVDEITGTATVVDSATNSKLNVTFPGIFNAPIPGGNYWIIVLDESDYTYAAVADPVGVTLFILSRTPQMDEDLYQNILSELESKGINTDRLIITPQPN